MPRPHDTDDTGYSRDGVQAPPLPISPDIAYRRLLARTAAEQYPPSRPKAMIDAALTDWRFLTLLDTQKVLDLLLDLRAEV